MSSPWVSAATILADNAFCNLDIEDADLIAKANSAAVDATSLLYVLSGRTLPGQRTVTVWPETTEARDPARRGPGTNMIALEWPIVEIVEVSIEDETLVEGTDYEVHDYRWLVRLPDEDGQVRVWPMSWTPGEFSITYTFGMEIPGWAVDAARELGVSILRQRLDLGRPLPEGTDGVSRQGLSYSLGQRAEALRNSATAETFPEVTRFLGLVNPGREPHASYAWSPDLGHQLHRVTSATSS